MIGVLGGFWDQYNNLCTIGMLQRCLRASVYIKKPAKVDAEVEVDNDDPSFFHAAKIRTALAKPYHYIAYPMIDIIAGAWSRLDSDGHL